MGVALSRCGYNKLQN